MKKMTKITPLNFTHLKVVDDPSLKRIPPHLPNLLQLELYSIGNSEKPHSKYINYHLHSFKDLPESLPRLKEIIINNSNISNFEDLIAEMPKLQTIRIWESNVHNFRGLPEKHLNLFIYDTMIDSFEGIEIPIPQNKEEMQLYIQNCTIRSLGGVSRSSIQAILIAIISQDYGRPPNPDYPEKIILNLTPTGYNLLLESINSEIERSYNPKYERYWPRIENPEQYSFPHQFVWHFSNEEGEPVELENASKKDWIYGFQLTERLFIPEKLDRLHEYYQKTTRELAQEYIVSPESLPSDQIERLIHEIDPNIRKLLENNLPFDNPVLIQISSKFNFKTQNGLLLK